MNGQASVHDYARARSIGNVRICREVSGTLWQGRPHGGEWQLWFQKSCSSSTRLASLTRSNHTRPILGAAYGQPGYGSKRTAA
jgi:hypothetical protein